MGFIGSAWKTYYTPKTKSDEIIEGIALIVLCIIFFGCILLWAAST